MTSIDAYCDGGKIHSYRSGQSLTLRIKKDDCFHNLHYCLIEPFNGKTYRIAIKDEIDHEPKGIVSNEIIDNYKEGDEILVSFPAGTFGLVQDAKHHLFMWFSSIYGYCRRFITSM